MKIDKAYKLRMETHKEMKRRIMENAADLFRKHGYQTTTMDDIAESLQISKVRIYRYWNSKEEILYETVRIVHKDLINSLKIITESKQHPDEKLRAAIANHATVFYTAILPVFGGIISPETLLTSKHKLTIIKLRDEYDSLLRHIIDEGSEKKIFIKCNSKLISFAILGAANYMTTWFSDEGHMSFEEVIGYISDYLINGILMEKHNEVWPAPRKSVQH